MKALTKTDFHFAGRNKVDGFLYASALVAFFPFYEDHNVRIRNSLFALLVAHVAKIKREGLRKDLHNPY